MSPKITDGVGRAAFFLEALGRIHVFDFSSFHGHHFPWRVGPSSIVRGVTHSGRCPVGPPPFPVDLLASLL